MIAHNMCMIKAAVHHVNPSQTPVIALDQPLFALAKQIKWPLPELSEAQFVIMLGGLHIEMASLKMVGQWLSGSGWAEVMCNTGVATQGVAESFLSASHVTRTRRAHQVTATSLHVLMSKAYSVYQAKLRENEQENLLSKEEWKDALSKKSPQFHYWSKVLNLELICLRLVRALREVHETTKLFSSIALDRCHEQVNAVVKGEGGTVGLTKNPAALSIWTVAGPEISRMVQEFEGGNSWTEENVTHHEQKPAVQNAFSKDVLNTVSSYEELGNPFLEKAWPGQGRTEERLAELKCFPSTSAHFAPQPVVDAVIIDRAVIVQMLQPKTVRTFDEYFSTVFTPYILKHLETAKRVDLVWDVYQDKSLKRSMREERVASILQADEVWVTHGSGKNVRNIAAHAVATSLGRDKALTLPMFRALTGCDILMFFNGRGKRTAWDVWGVFPELTPVLRVLQASPEEITDDCMAVLERFVVFLYDYYLRTIQGKDINRRVVCAAFEMGIGREGVAKLCEILNMPFSISIDTWYNHEEILHAAHNKVTKEQLKANANEVKQVAIDEGTSRNDKSSIVDIPVTFDCTWSKKGLTANHCVGSACKDKPHHLDAVFEEPLLKICERLRGPALLQSCGATKKHDVVREAGLAVGQHTNRASKRRDSGRVKQAVERVQEKHKKYRLARKQAKAKEEELQVRREGTTYEAGGFNDIAPVRASKEKKEQVETVGIDVSSVSM
ncbi:hypothetical protein AWC38_SpisGene17659 [Stylophora pistillata]|uniref:Mutator-like transposase domain-containing protein n=1 Tax=Stylophora pistillata TaxID=50429 RepID=A0A2B4RHX9_STYPI|nr:hypothetical protein AWC38_SpisGene17659 [Stylophora pistillata]